MVVPVHMLAVEEEEEQRKPDEGCDRTRQWETVAALAVDHLGDGGEGTDHVSRRFFPLQDHTHTDQPLTDPTSTCSTISPVLALVTRTVVAQPEDGQRSPVFITCVCLYLYTFAPPHVCVSDLYSPVCLL